MILLGVLIILALMGLNYLFDFISPEEKLGWMEYIERGLQIGNTIIITWIAIRFMRFIIWDPYAAKHKRPAPKSLVDLVNIGIIALAVIYATTGIFGADLWAIVAAGGLLGAGFAFALQGPILDLFSGVVLDLEKPYKVGDWLELPSDVMGKGGMMGKVVAKNWRTTTLEDPDQTYIIVPNGLLSKKGFRNFHRPQSRYMDSILIALDHELPIERGERILRAAILTVPEIAQYPDNCEAFALVVNSGGVDYCVRYTVGEVPKWRKIRHEVLSAITENLHGYNFRISETIGTYGLMRFGPLIKEPPLAFLDAAAKVDLFQSLSKKELDEMAKKIHPHLYRANQQIVHQGNAGDSMYIIGEGTAEVYSESKKKGKTIKHHLALLGPNTYFGDMALLLGEKRSATVAAKTDMITFEISKKMMQPILKNRPAIAQKLSEMVATRQLSTKRVMDMHAKDIAKQKAALSDQILGGIKQFFGI